MSLSGLLMSVLAPFRTPPTVDRQRVERQTRESDALLRQLRAELRLMQRWKDDRERGSDRAR